MIAVRWQEPSATVEVAPAITIPMHPANVILREVAARRGLTLEELLAPTRAHSIAHARQEAMWLMRHTTSMSLPEIARRCGMKDHTTAYHGIRAHEARIAAQRRAA